MNAENAKFSGILFDYNLSCITRVRMICSVLMGLTFVIQRLLVHHILL